MKISKQRLTELIQEELTIGVSRIEGDEPVEHGQSDGSMAKQNLWKMAEYAKELYNLISDEEDLEPWVEEKIAIASYMMDSVGHYMQYQKSENPEADMHDEDMENHEDESDESEESEEEYEFVPDEDSDSEDEFVDGEEGEEEYEEEYEDEV